MSTLTENNPSNPKIDLTVDAILSSIEGFLQEYPASEVAGYIALATKELCQPGDNSNPQRNLNTIRVLSEVTAFIIMLHELNTDLVIKSLQNTKQGE